MCFTIIPSFKSNRSFRLHSFYFNLNKMYDNTSLWRRAFDAPTGSASMARYYDSQLCSSLRSLLARRTFGTPKDNGVDASIDIFLVSSLEYHLI